MSIPLYTTLTKVKQELRDGRPVPMTPLPESTKGIIDPDFTPGLGALHEDDDMGLRCPVVGCGQYYHDLGKHAAHKHGDLGSAAGLKGIMGIAPSTALLSSRAMSTKCESASRGASKRITAGGMRMQVRARPIPAVTSAARRTAARAVGARNLRNECDAQLSARMWELYHKIGRSPSREEAIIADPRLVTAARWLYGSWDNAKLQMGMQPRRKKIGYTYNKNSVLAALSEYATAHGDLPLRGDTSASLPLLPSWPTILRHMGTASWTDAMRRAAIALGLKESRYLEAASRVGSAPAENEAAD